MEYKNLHEIIKILEYLFSKFNELFFDGILQKPVITIFPYTSRGILGWCTTWKPWKEKMSPWLDDNSESEDGSEGFYEINICAEYLARPFLEICATLLHEMVHLKNLQDDIKDCSRNGYYHNMDFKVAAEQHGLFVEKSPRHGWNQTKLTEKSVAIITSAYGENQPFGLYRSRQEKTNKQCTKKYICPSCGTIIRATREVRVTCTDCEIEFKEQVS